MASYVLGFHEIDQTDFALVGGKAAHLGELSRIEGIRVPAGFCVTASVFQRIIAKARLHPGGHRGAEAGLVRSAKLSGDHRGDGGHLVAQ
jgi:phosphoenolpyruvate synthase/pyruvate phosphate dikinase